MLLLHLVSGSTKLIMAFDSLNFTLWSDFRAHSYTLVLMSPQIESVAVSLTRLLQPTVSLSLSLGAFADLLIAITFSTYLLRGRNQYSRYVHDIVSSREGCTRLRCYGLYLGRRGRLQTCSHYTPSTLAPQPRMSCFSSTTSLGAD